MKTNLSRAIRAIRAASAVSCLPLVAAALLGAQSPAAHADDAAATATGGAVAATATTAAAGGAAEATESTRAEGLQEVVVTATRHEESLSKVPISVTALTQDAMDQRGIKDFQDIARFTPGVSIDNSGTNAISIRGISSSAGAGTTGIYIDDTPIQMRNVGFNPEDTLPKTFDLERVEILRGPQGTLFGAGSEGGAVRYILTQPSLTATSTYVRTEVSYTEYGQPSYEFGIAHGMPIIDGVLGIRASAWYRYDGGWINRVSDISDPADPTVTAHNVNYDHVLVLRVAALWQPASSLTVTPSVLYQNRQEHDQPTYWPAYSNPGAGDFNTATPERIPDPDRYYLPALKVQWELGKSEIISDTSYYNRQGYTGYQGTVYDLAFYQSLGWGNNPLFGTAVGSTGLGCQATPAVNASGCPWYPLLDGRGIHLPVLSAATCASLGVPAGCFANEQTPNVMTNTQESYTQELRWQSNDETSRLRWTLGAFWQLAKEGSIENLTDTEINPFFEYLWGTFANGQLVAPGPTATSLFGPYYSCPTAVNYPAIPACSIYYNNNTTFDRQLAGYGELSYALTEKWRLTVGERVARHDFSLDHYADGLENFGPSPAQASESDTSSTPKVSLSWQIDNDDMVYATYGKGFRPGGGNAPLPPYCNPDLEAAGYPHGAPLTYRPDDTQNYEIGSKNSFGQALRIATSLYYIKWNGIQQNVYVAGTCGLQFTDNLGVAVAKGFDLQAEALMGPLHLDLAVGYTNARFTQNSYPGGNPNVPRLVSAGDAISGEAAIDYAPGTNPPWTVAVGPEYRFNLGTHESFVRVDYEYESRNPWLAAVQDPMSSQYQPTSYTLPATHFASLRAGVTLGDWLVTPFIDNLFNTHVITNYALGQMDPYNPCQQRGAPNCAPTVQENDYTFRPRTFGITATWHAGPGG
jgi:iron complex outermembrane recepter protein